MRVAALAPLIMNCAAAGIYLDETVIDLNLFSRPCNFVDSDIIKLLGQRETLFPLNRLPVCEKMRIYRVAIIPSAAGPAQSFPVGRYFCSSSRFPLGF